jgi:hypothetical protein
MEAAGSFTLPASRKAAKQKQHPTAAFTETVEDIDINRSIHQGYLMCRDMLTDLGYKGILKVRQIFNQPCRKCYGAQLLHLQYVTHAHDPVVNLQVYLCATFESDCP